MAVVQRPVAAITPQNQQCGGLQPADVAARVFARRQRRDQTFGERTGRLLERTDHAVHNITAGEAVPERDAAIPG